MPRPLYPRVKSPGIHWIGGWVGPRTGLDDVENRKFLNLPALELRPFGRPTSSQSLYRLRYPGSYGDLKCLLHPLIKEGELKMCPLYV
jgi:hypothetical protein